MSTRPVKPRVRSDLHLTRKLWHVGAVGAMFLIYKFTPDWVSLCALIISTILFIPFDFWRKRNPTLNKRLVGYFSMVIRDYEVHGLAGTTYLLIGTWIILLIFPRQVMELTLLFLAIGDPVASLSGIWFGRDKILGTKTLQGSLGAFVICSLLALAYFYFENLMVERLLLVSAGAGLIAALSELVPIRKLDDNLTFPILCATSLYVLFSLFGGL